MNFKMNERIKCLNEKSIRSHMRFNDRSCGPCDRAASKQHGPVAEPSLLLGPTQK